MAIIYTFTLCLGASLTNNTSRSPLEQPHRSPVHRSRVGLEKSWSMASALRSSQWQGWSPAVRKVATMLGLAEEESIAALL
uniref:Uncharacterized protein n=1 Tax=Arundo donax TaxID=35708 RepID=A0A0A9E562_ARUDO